MRAFRGLKKINRDHWQQHQNEAALEGFEEGPLFGYLDDVMDLAAVWSLGDGIQGDSLRDAGRPIRDEEPEVYRISFTSMREGGVTSLPGTQIDRSIDPTITNPRMPRKAPAPPGPQSQVI